MTFLRPAIAIGAILLAVGGCAGQSRAKKADSPDLKEIRDYRLNMDILQKYIKAYKTVMADPAAKKCAEYNSPGNARTLDEGEKLLNTCAPAVADLNAAGVKPREFLIVTAAVLGDFMAVSMKKAGTIKEYPSSISPENAAFLEQNWDKLQVLVKPLMGDDK